MAERAGPNLITKLSGENRIQSKIGLNIDPCVKKIRFRNVSEVSSLISKTFIYLYKLVNLAERS